MKEITVSCAGLDTREALHAAIAQALSFPEWYGHNLDALYDCLTDLDDPVHLRLVQWAQLPDWKVPFAAVLEDAEKDCDTFTVCYE